MGTHTILDELEAIFDGLNVAAGNANVTFAWTEWEEQEEVAGPYVSAESSFDLEVSDIGGGAQAALETVTLRFAWENQGRDAAWATWKNAFISQVLALVRGSEKTFTGGYFVEVQEIEPFRRRLNPSRGAPVYANFMDFVIVARRHDVYV